MWFFKNNNSKKIRDAQILFYASHAVDEVWVRSTIDCCARYGHKLALAITEGLLSQDIMQLYHSLNVPVYLNAEQKPINECRARITVTASSGVPETLFPKNSMYRIHMPHSLVSLHMIYPIDAFDSYNILFAAGPHQIAEFEALTRLRGLPARHCFMTGYGKMDIFQDRKTFPPETDKLHILLAPSWGEKNIINLLGLELIQNLLQSGYRVILRPHPLFFLEQDQKLAEIENSYSAHEFFTLENSVSGDAGIFDADILMTDYSGIAQEFAALNEKPVIFIDVPKKICNPDWEDIGIEPLELRSRGMLGPLVAPEIAPIAKAMQQIIEEKEKWRGLCQAFIPEFIYSGHCGEKAAYWLGEMLAGHDLQRVQT